MLLKFLVMRVEIAELIRQDVGVRHEVKVLLAKAFLHPHYVVAKSILPGDLVTRWEMVDFLILVQAFIDVRLAATRAPQDIPLMRLSMGEAIVLKH